MWRLVEAGRHEGLVTAVADLQFNLLKEESCSGLYQGTYMCGSACGVHQQGALPDSSRVHYGPACTALVILHHIAGMRFGCRCSCGPVAKMHIPVTRAMSKSLTERPFVCFSMEAHINRACDRHPGTLSTTSSVNVCCRVWCECGLEDLPANASASPFFFFFPSRQVVPCTVHPQLDLPFRN